MMPAPQPLSAPVRAMLDQESLIPAVSPAARARVMAQARAALLARDERLFVPARPVAHTRWAAAAVLVAVTAVAAGAGAYALRAHLAASPAKPVAGSPAPAPVAAPRSRPRGGARAAVAAPAQAPAAPAVAPARLPTADAIRAELRLLRQARAAISRDDFSAALPPLADHARRFQDGRLAEEREALRVKALAGLGRTEEAQRAAAAFNTRFPRSVLSPAVSKMPSSRP